MTPLHFTGHALVDVGLAGLCALAGRKEPEHLSAEDLDAAADLMERHYYGGALGPYLSCVFMNSSFVQPKEGADKKAAFIAQYLRAHRVGPHPSVAGRRCVFSGEPAISPLVRTHFPLFSGEGVMNFRPGGETWVPAAGPYVVALMFLPLASRRSEGRLLAVHADAPELTLRFAKRYLEDNQRILAMALPAARAPVHPGFAREQPMWDAQNKRYKLPDAKGPRSLVVYDLTAIAAEALTGDGGPPRVALTAYLLSSSGQGPSLDFFHVPSGVVSFIAQAGGPTTAKAWRVLASRFRPLVEQDEDGAPKKKAKKKAEPIPGRAGWSRNPAFEELCAVFEGGYTDKAAAGRWLRRHVLGRMDRAGDKASYRGGGARSFKLAELFLKEVLGMKKGRIEAIRAFADKLAQWIFDKTDKKLYHALVFDRLGELQHALRRVQRESAGGTLLFGLDEYREVWLHEDGDGYLVRDLLCIRIVERLHELGYFSRHPEDALTTEEADQNAERAPEEEGAMS